MIDHPRMENIRVALNRLCRSPESHKEPTSATVAQQAMVKDTDPVQAASSTDAEQDPRPHYRKMKMVFPIKIQKDMKERLQLGPMR